MSKNRPKQTNQPPLPGSTIAAVGTPPGRGGVGIIRLSGKHLAELALVISSAPEQTKPLTLQPRYAHFANFYGVAGDLIDSGLLLYFPAPHSFTGEDVLELQGHGSPVAQQQLLRRCIELGARLAEPGEFSKRAFLNGKMDLAQAEAVADLINATTEAAARSAVRSLSGEFSSDIEQLRHQMIELRMLVEASLDFPEEDIDFVKASKAEQRIGKISQELRQTIHQAQQGQILRDGMTVVLVGAPNVGKSSLLNRLAGHERAIVTDVAGTTRDALKESIAINGVPLHIIDTAGLRHTEDEIERLGIARTWQEIDNADMVLYLFVANGEGDQAHQETKELEVLLPRLANKPLLSVCNKADLLSEQMRQQFLVFAPRANKPLLISAKTGEGLEQLRAALLHQVGWQGDEQHCFLARARHLDALRRAADSLDAALLCASNEQLEFMAEELRMAQQYLGEITGSFSADDLLGVIFSQFCIGK